MLLRFLSSRQDPQSVSTADASRTQRAFSCAFEFSLRNKIQLSVEVQREKRRQLLQTHLRGLTFLFKDSLMPCEGRSASMPATCVWRSPKVPLSGMEMRSSLPSEVLILNRMVSN